MSYFLENMQNSARRHVLADIRLSCGLSQKGLARYLVVHPMSVQKIEQGLFALSSKMAAKIQEKLGVSAEWLLANDFSAPPVTPQGLPWYKEQYERILVASGAPKAPSIFSNPYVHIAYQKELSELRQLYLDWKREEFNADIAAHLAGAEKSHVLGAAGVLQLRIEQALKKAFEDFTPDAETRASYQTSIDKCRQAYLEHMARLETEATKKMTPRVVVQPQKTKTNQIQKRKT
jgi:transcriptional regulator with XRE-family HTH domain